MVLVLLFYGKIKNTYYTHFTISLITYILFYFSRVTSMYHLFEEMTRDNLVDFVVSYMILFYGSCMKIVLDLIV